LKHYPYDRFVTICCWCFKNVINSIHKTIIHCIKKNFFIWIIKCKPIVFLGSFENL
jgi:hypothetical protein